MKQVLYDKEIETLISVLFKKTKTHLGSFYEIPSDLSNPIFKYKTLKGRPSIVSAEKPSKFRIAEIASYSFDLLDVVITVEDVQWSMRSSSTAIAPP